MLARLPIGKGEVLVENSKGSLLRNMKEVKQRGPLYNTALKGHGNDADEPVRHTVGPLHYVSSRSDFSFEL